MKTDHTEYRFKDSVGRINQIMAAWDNPYEERERIPARNALTYTNGFYVKCSVLFVEIRTSAELTDFHRNPFFAKPYRTYVSEVTAIMNGNQKCAEINVLGNCVSGFFDTPYEDDVNEVFSVVGKISSIVDIMNYEFKKKNLKEITIGIGLSYGKALVVKAGFKSSSSVEEVIWMGDAVNEAAKLASYGNMESADREAMVSEVVYYNLHEKNKKLLTPNLTRNCYHGDIVNSLMNSWYEKNCP